MISAASGATPARSVCPKSRPDCADTGHSCDHRLTTRFGPERILMFDEGRRRRLGAVMLHPLGQLETHESRCFQFAACPVTGFVPECIRKLQGESCWCCS